MPDANPPDVDVNPPDINRPGVNLSPDVNLPPATTRPQDRRPPQKRRAATKRTAAGAELDDDTQADKPLPEGDSSKSENIGYWRRLDSATKGEYIDTFERVLHRHVIKTCSIKFKCDAPDPLLVEMLQAARTEYRKPGKPEPMGRLKHVDFDVPVVIQKFSSHRGHSPVHSLRYLSC